MNSKTEPDSATRDSPVNSNFSPMLIAGMMIKPLPKAPLNQLLKHISRKIQNNHPAILDRLQPLNGTHFLIQPTDFPHKIRLIIGKARVECEIEDEFMAPTDVTISGTLKSLMDMMDGKVDGDALFFSRELTIEGDTEALLTLRNAMDSDDIDLREEILHSLGIFKNPAGAILKIGDHLFSHMSHDMNKIAQAITAPLSSRCDLLEQQNQGLRQKITTLEKTLSKTQNRVQSLSRQTSRQTGRQQKDKKTIS